MISDALHDELLFDGLPTRFFTIKISSVVDQSGQVYDSVLENFQLGASLHHESDDQTGGRGVTGDDRDAAKGLMDVS